MTDDLAPDLDAIARSLPELPSSYATLRALMAALPGPVMPDVLSARDGSADIAQSVSVGSLTSDLTSANLPGTEPGGSIGILPQLFYGQSNVIADPELADLAFISPVGTVENSLGSWFAKYVVNSGAVAGTRQVFVNYVHGDTFDNPFNSHDGEYHITGISAAASNVDYYLRSKTWSPSNIPGQTGGLLVVGALRVTNILSQVVTNVTSALVRLELTDHLGNVIATGTAVDFVTLPYTGARQLTVSTPHVAFRSYRLRLKISVIATGSGGNINVDFGEPQLSFSTTERPGPYTPLISANWQPAYLRFTQNLSSSDVIAVRRMPLGDTFDRWTLSGLGEQRWGPGTSSTLDVLLARGVAGMLILSANGSANPTYLDIQATSGQTNNLRMYVAGDSVERTLIAGDAGLTGIRFGSGGATHDVQAKRAAAGILLFDSNSQAVATNPNVVGTSGQRSMLDVYVAGDSFARARLSGDATFSGIAFSGGGAAFDAEVYRQGPGNLYIDSNGQAVATNVDIFSTSGQRNRLGMALFTDGVHRVWLEGSATITGLHFGPGGAGGLDVRFYRSGAKAVKLDDVAGGAAQLSVTGLIDCNGGYFSNGTAVIGNRRTGWTVPTGTAQRGTFATDTVTLINLARAVKALIDDLHNAAGHGLIGT